MNTTPFPSKAPATPADALAEKLQDPKVAESLIVLLEHAELLATLATGLSGFLERGDQIVDAVVEGVHDFKEAAGSEASKLPDLSEVGALAGRMHRSAPVLDSLLDSKMFDVKTIGMLSDLSAATEVGFEKAQADKTRVTGLFAGLGVLKDPEVQRGLGLLVEVARAIGRQLDQNS